MHTITMKTLIARDIVRGIPRDEERIDRLRRLAVCDDPNYSTEACRILKEYWGLYRLSDSDVVALINGGDY